MKTLLRDLLLYFLVTLLNILLAVYVAPVFWNHPSSLGMQTACVIWIWVVLSSLFMFNDLWRQGRALCKSKNAN